MSPHQLVTLLLSHIIVAFLIWLGCRSIYETRLAAGQKKIEAIAAEGVWTMEQLCAVRDQFRALEAQLIDIQLVMEQTQDLLEERENLG